MKTKGKFFRKAAILSSTLAFAMTLAATWLAGQGIDTAATQNITKDDWEEIQFEFNSSVLVDGFPSLLRLSELLQKNAAFKVRVEGHTDGIGSDSYNEQLAQRRANAVKDFLIKYGARATQIETSSRGKSAPRAKGEKGVFTPTDEARYMNRRVVLYVMDAQGRQISGGSTGDAIRVLGQNAGDMTDCCSEVLKRLDKLDEIAKMLRDLADQNAGLRKELADLRDKQNSLQAAQDALAKGQSAAQQAANASQQDLAKNVQQGQQSLADKINALGSREDLANAAADAIARQREASRFQLLGVNIGSDGSGNVTFTGSGRYFQTLGSRFGVQAQGEYMYWKTQKEGQFDIGLVDRITRRMQAGLFASFKHVDMSGTQNGATLGQAALTVDYLFKRGRVGVFGTKGFMDGGVINRANLINAQGFLMNNVIQERYLQIVDQAGISGTVGLFGKTYLVGNAGYLKSYGSGDRLGGTLRFVFPLNSKIALTAEGGVNETLLARDNNGRAAFGVQFGNFMQPKDYLDSGKPVPAEVPRVRYEVLNRTLRIGNDPPVADAGPDRANAAPGAIQLDGSNSYDPDGDPITYQWIQEGGTTVALSNATAARTTFNAIAGNVYIFKLVVKDDKGGQGQARVTISTRTADRPQLLFFIADPREIQLGGSSQLQWRVTGADSVSIDNGVGTVPTNGSVPVSPTQTTVYTLTARNANGTETATATVSVVAPAAKLLYCYAQPANITSGQSTTLNWSAPNATSVTIQPNIGAVAKTGTVTVSPTQTTAYTLTAVGPNNTTQDSCGIVVTVGAGGGGGAAPIIVRFSANPSQIVSGQQSNLLWQVQNADKVSISTVGDVALNGDRNVSPATTTTYTLTATNANGSSTATATVGVTELKILSFTADPTLSPSAGSKVTLTCDTSGATSLLINGITFLPPKASAVVFPTQDTTYTCTATANGQSVSKTVDVKIDKVTPPTTTVPTIVIAGGLFQQTIYRDIVLDASASFSAIGNAPLKFFWETIDSQAAIIDPTVAAPRIQLTTLGGDHLFRVTVTDSKGNSGQVIVTVRYMNSRTGF